MKRLLASSVVLLVTGFMISSSGAATASPARTCTATSFHACSFGHWLVYNNPWGPTPGTYVIHARSQSHWSVTANQNGGGGCGGCAVEAFESAQWDYPNIRYSLIKYLYSSFSETMPTGSLKRNHFDAEATYDMFIKGSDTDEVMVWVDNQGQTPSGRRYGVAVIGGQKFIVYAAGVAKIFRLIKNETSGKINYFAILRWLHQHHMLASSDRLSQFNFGWEICDTGGRTRTFTVHGLTLHQKFR